MGAEQKPASALKIARDRALYAGVRLAEPIIKRGQERIADSTSVKFERGYLERYMELRREGYFPVDISNHTAQQDADSMALVTDSQVKLEESLGMPKDKRLKGFHLPLALTLDTGNHGPTIQAIYRIDHDLLIAHHLTPLLLARKVDVNEGNVKPNLIEFYKAMSDGFGDGISIAVFAGGNTFGGKKGANSKINGMHAFERDSMRSIVSAAQRAGRKTMIVPIGLEGGFRIQVPETKLPSRWALRIGLGFSDRSLTHVRVGLPLPTNQGELGELISARDWVGANTFVERHIAGLLPPSHRGIHRNDYFSS